jgi:hypothetical protein
MTAATAAHRYREAHPDIYADWYEVNRPVILSKIRQRCRMKRYQAVEYLGGHCVDCGFDKDLNGLTFDHLPERGEPDRAALHLTGSWARIKAELDKCELVCGTCHLIRTAQRRGEQ